MLPEGPGHTSNQKARDEAVWMTKTAESFVTVAIKGGEVIVSLGVPSGGMIQMLGALDVARDRLICLLKEDPGQPGEEDDDGF